MHADDVGSVPGGCGRCCGAGFPLGGAQASKTTDEIVHSSMGNCKQSIEVWRAILNSKQL